MGKYVAFILIAALAFGAGLFIAGPAPTGTTAGVAR